MQPLFGNSFKPMFRGRFVESDGRVVLRGVYEVAKSTRAYMTLWLGLAALITALGVVGSLIVPDDEVIPLAPFVPLAFFALGVGFVRWGWWYSRDDIVVMNIVIKRALTPQRAASAHKQSGPR